MITLLALIAVVCRALNRNHHRQLRPTANGLTDRDLQRLVDDLRARS